jgi:hypothetical protein
VVLYEHENWSPILEKKETECFKTKCLGEYRAKENAVIDGEICAMRSFAIHSLA